MFDNVLSGSFKVGAKVFAFHMTYIFCIALDNDFKNAMFISFYKVVEN